LRTDFRIAKIEAHIFKLRAKVMWGSSSVQDIVLLLFLLFLLEFWVGIMTVHFESLIKFMEFAAGGCWWEEAVVG
jgi:hypothetical protein